ncbi:hypothetical protein ACLBXX_09460 [Microbacterium sp. C23T]
MPTLNGLAAGGRGGLVRLRLYLTMAMQASSVPRTIPPKTSAAYARLISLDARTGPRRVNDALRHLDERGLIHRELRTGRAPQITVLNPNGSGDDWPDRTEDRWITVPLEFWSGGWIFRMSARAIAAYISLRELLGGSKHKDGQFMSGFRKGQYGISDDTWTRALKELKELGVLIETIEPGGDDEHPYRTRRRYRLIELSDVKASRADRRATSD